MATIKIPPVLRASVGGEKEVGASGANVGEVGVQAAELGLPYAEPVDLGVRWDTGAPMPVLLSGLRTFVAFYLSTRDPRFAQPDPGRPDPVTDHGVGIVEGVRDGFFEDDVFAGLGRGRNDFTMAIVGDTHDDDINILVIENPPVVGGRDRNLPLPGKRLNVLRVG